MNDKKKNPVLNILAFKIGKVSATLLLIIFVAVIIAGVLLFNIAENNRKNEAQISTISTLKKIVNISELSTLKTVYNGVAVVYNEKDIEKKDIDFYVSYEATVKTGIDFSKIEIELNDDNVITVKVPDVHITDYTVQPTSLDYIFYNDKANSAGVSDIAFDSCKEDLKNECENNDTILKLAKENSKQAIEALFKPIVEQLGQNYTLVVE